MLGLMPTGNIMVKKWGKNILNFTRSRQCSKRWWIIFKFRITHQKRLINQSPRLMNLWSRPTRRLRHYKMEILKKWWNVNFQTWDHLNKSIWTHHESRNQRWQCFVPQELPQPHQDVSQCSPPKHTPSLKNNSHQIVILEYTDL